ncbi:MAG TPA: VTT domain-containing protein [Candidatus Limnocylindrales bacterium]|nr:VTT domain-containing protein [Candidatus Limnocylindrales bacterium]
MFEVTNLIESGGLLLIAAIIFAESGLLAGFFLPGDTLLFTAGFFAAQGKLPLPSLLLLVVVAAIAGYEVGYHIGQKFGKRLFRKKDGLLFRQEYLEKSEVFYEKHGGKTVMLSRFVPVVRTFAPIIAGIGNMPRLRFRVFNAAGALVWGGGIVLLGYWLGSKIPDIDKYLLPIVGIAMVFTFSPMVLHLVTDKELRHRLRQRIRRS